MKYTFQNENSVSTHMYKNICNDRINDILLFQNKNKRSKSNIIR